MSQADDSERREHRCRSGKTCVARSSDGAAQTVKPKTLCPMCVEAVQSQRDALPQLREGIRVCVGIKPVTAMVSKVSSTPLPACPINLAADSLLNSIDETLARVGSTLIRDLVQQPPQRHRFWRGDVEQQAWLDGVDLALQIRRVHQRATKMLGLEAQWQRRHAPCWGCGLPTLGQLSGSGTVECSSCGDRKTDSDYDKYCAELVAERKVKKSGK